MSASAVDDPVVTSAVHRGVKVMGMMSEGSRARLDWLIREYDVRSVIEVGSFMGLSACFFADRVEQVTCFDSWEWTEADTPIRVDAYRRRGYPVDIPIYETFLNNTRAYPNITSFRLDSLTAAARSDDADLVYIDAGHSFDEVVADVTAWRPHARKVLCGDDNQKRNVNAAIVSLGIPDSGERIWWQVI